MQVFELSFKKSMKMILAKKADKKAIVRFLRC